MQALCTLTKRAAAAGRLYLPLGLLLAGCGPVALLTSRSYDAGALNYGHYYLPKKTLEVTVPYTAEYEYRHRRVRPLVQHNKPVKGPHYDPVPIITTAKVRLPEQATMRALVTADQSTPYFLTTSNRRGFNSFEVVYSDTGEQVLKSINSAFTPTGSDLAVTSLKVASTLLPVLAKAVTRAPANADGALPPEPMATDSVVKKTVLLPVKKLLDISAVSDDSLRAAPAGYVALRFGRADVALEAGLVAPVPVIEVLVAPEQAPPAAATQAIFAAQVQSLRAGSSATVGGVLYRQAYFCSIFTRVTRQERGGAVTVTSYGGRESFPQKGLLSVQPVRFSRKRNKQSAALEFNAERGGLTRFKSESENGSSAVLTEAGNAAKVALEAYNTARDNRSELQRLKSENELLDEKIKQLQKAKTLGELSAPPQ